MVAADREARWGEQVGWLYFIHLRKREKEMELG